MNLSEVLFYQEFQMNEFWLFKDIYNKEKWDKMIEDHKEICEITENINLFDSKFLSYKKVNGGFHIEKLGKDKSIPKEEFIRRVLLLMSYFYKYYKGNAKFLVEPLCYKGILYVKLNASFGNIVKNTYPLTIFLNCNSNYDNFEENIKKNYIKSIEELTYEYSNEQLKDNKILSKLFKKVSKLFKPSGE